MRRPQIKASQRRQTISASVSNDWKDSRLVVAALSVAGTATLFATVIMPLSNTLLTNKIEKLTELSANSSAIAEELEKTKKELAASRAENRLALEKSPFVPGSVYPFGLDNVVIGTPAQEVVVRLPGAKWDEDNSYITFDVKEKDTIFSGAAYYFNSARNVSGILYHFRNQDTGPAVVKKLLLTGFGEPYAQKKRRFLWRVSDHEWATLSEVVSGVSTFTIDSFPSPSDWGGVSAGDVKLK
ncbi:hypothetical protein [Burkholderia semiarida]|uniref:hypothetical protein n=1 Tax=Burkholderia semiarida TaxID=2843303 RepID=UPI003877C490